MAKARAWVFTRNNYSDPKAPFAWLDQVKFCVWQEEVGANGTPHLQGYVVLQAPQRTAWVSKHLDDKAHWEVRKGTHEQAKAYCTKPETRKPDTSPYTYGESPVGGGTRTDITAFRDAIKSGATDAQLFEDHTGNYLRYMRTLTRVRALIGVVEPKRQWMTELYIYWGPAGTGKSRRAGYEAGPEAYWLAKPASRETNLWWDGYNGQENVVIDEFYGWMPRDTMQRLADRNPLLVRVQEGHTPFLAKRIFITSNQEPERWWKNLPDFAPMRRRITKCEWMPGPGVWEPPVEVQPLAAQSGPRECTGIAPVPPGRVPVQHIPVARPDPDLFVLPRSGPNPIQAAHLTREEDFLRGVQRRALGLDVDGENVVPRVVEHDTSVESQESATEDPAWLRTIARVSRLDADEHSEESNAAFAREVLKEEDRKWREEGGYLGGGEMVLDEAEPRGKRRFEDMTKSDEE